MLSPNNISSYLKVIKSDKNLFFLSSQHYPLEHFRLFTDSNVSVSLVVNILKELFWKLILEKVIFIIFLLQMLYYYWTSTCNFFLSRSFKVTLDISISP